MMPAPLTGRPRAVSMSARPVPRPVVAGPGQHAPMVVVMVVAPVRGADHAAHQQYIVARAIGGVARQRFSVTAAIQSRIAYRRRHLQNRPSPRPYSPDTGAGTRCGATQVSWADATVARARGALLPAEAHSHPRGAARRASARTPTAGTLPGSASRCAGAPGSLLRAGRPGLQQVTAAGG